MTNPADAGRPVPASSPLNLESSAVADAQGKLVSGSATVQPSVPNGGDSGHSAAEGVPRLQAIRERLAHMYVKGAASADTENYSCGDLTVGEARDLLAELDRLTATCAQLQRDNDEATDEYITACKQGYSSRAEAALADLRAQIARLEQAWRTDAKEHHLAAANFAAIDAQADYMRHLDVAGTYRKCADALAALRPAGAEEP